MSFSISLPTSDPAVDVLELWTPGEPSASGGEVWRAVLPDDPLAAAELLDERERQARRARRALSSAQHRLQADLAALVGGLAFSTSLELSPAQNILAAGLRYQGQALAYSGLEDLPVDPRQLDQAAGSLARLIEQAQRAAGQAALVETSSGGRKSAVTRVSWAGDVETWWAAGGTREQRFQHGRVLAQALDTRQAWLRCLCILAGGVTRVAAALATGPFSLISIWTTWTYLQHIVREAKILEKTLNEP